jgi:hypothetical protein
MEKCACVQIGFSAHATSFHNEHQRSFFSICQQPIQVYDAVLAGQRVLFVGHAHAAQEVSVWWCAIHVGIH